MMKPLFLAMALLGATALAACQPNPPDLAHNSQNALDWPGRYEGGLPCADCPGLKTELSLYKDGSYRLNETYLEKSKPMLSRGTFTWDQSGSIITLKGKGEARRFKVGEGRLWQLDTEGREIKGPLAEYMILTKK